MEGGNMIRIGLLVAAIGCFSGGIGTAGDPAAAVVVVSDRGTASLLECVPKDSVLVVLIETNEDVYDVVNARALKLRHATHFVYHSGRESPLSNRP